MSKNIEKIKGEEALSEIVDITLDDAKLNGLVSNDVADMYQSASGLKPLKPIDAYESPIVELKANLKLIFRRLFSVPLTILGSNKEASPISIIKMMEQMFNHYRERLKGSEEYGIPSRLDQLSDLPDAPALLADRKISEPNAIDGISLANQLTSDAAASLTEIKDTNHGWTMKRAIPSYFSGLKKITLGCKRWEESTYRLNPMISGLTSLEEVELEDLEYIPDDAIGNRTTCSLLSGLTACHTVWADKLKRARIVAPTGGNGAVMFWNMPALKKVYMRGLDYLNVYRTDNFVVRLASADSIEELYLGPMNNYAYNKVNLVNQTKLLKIDFPNGLNNSMNLGTWSPTLDSSNLHQFLQNFKTYILLRLAKMTPGTAKTLTLSAAVYRAIYGLDSSDVADPTSAARTLTLSDLGITELTDIEIAAGITLDTLYYSAIDTYRGAIYWNIAK